MSTVIKFPTPAAGLERLIRNARAEGKAVVYRGRGRFRPPANDPNDQGPRAA